LHPNAVIAAIADPDETSRTRAQALIEKGWTGEEGEGYVSYYASHADLLARTDIDVVIIATPNHTHIDVLRDAIPTGKHILCEKPLCTTLDDCFEVHELYEAQPTDQRGLLWVGMEYRYMAPLLRVAHELREGTIGRLRMLSLREHRFPFLRKVGDWNRFNANTGGTLVEKACHFFDLMCYLTAQHPQSGEGSARAAHRSMPLGVYATGGQAINHLDERYGDEQRTPDILDHAYVLIDFDSGVRASLEMSLFAEASANQFEVSLVGERGKLEAFMPGHGEKDMDMHAPNVRIGVRAPEMVQGWASDRPPPPAYTKGCVREVAAHLNAKIAATGDHHGSTYVELEGLIRSVQRGATKANVSIADSVVAIACGVAAQRSLAEQRRVSLSEVVDMERLTRMFHDHDAAAL